MVGATIRVIVPPTGIDEDGAAGVRPEDVV